MIFFYKESNFFISFFFGGGGGGKGRMYFSINWQERNPNLTKNLFFFRGGGGGGGGVKRGWGGHFKWHFYSSKRTPVQNYFEIHA